MTAILVGRLALALLLVVLLKIAHYASQQQDEDQP